MSNLQIARDIKITRKHLKLGSVTVIDPVVHYQGRKVVCDGQLPGKLSRLVPQPWGNASAEEWRPFVTMAVAMGVL